MPRTTRFNSDTASEGSSRLNSIELSAMQEHVFFGGESTSESISRKNLDPMKLSEEERRLYFTKINGKYYRIRPSIDKSIVRINREFYLKSDKSIVQTHFGDWIKIEDSIKTWDNKYFHKETYGLKALVGGGTGVDSVNCVRYNNRYYALNHKDIVELPKDSRGRSMDHAHRNECTFISNNTHLSGFYDLSRNVVKCFYSDMDFRKEDCYKVTLYKYGNKYVNKISAEKIKLHTVIEDYNLSSHFQLIHKICINPNQCDDIAWSERFQSYVVKDMKSSIIKAYLKYRRDNKIKSKTKKFKSRISSNKEDISTLSFLNGEKISDVIDIVSGEISGGHQYFESNQIARRPIYSQTLVKLGGMDYTFGIEHESCAGIVPDYVIDKYGLLKMGDGSTRMNSNQSHPDNVIHYEYVTSVLHGDVGVDKFYEYLPKIGDHILMNDKCSTHFHIGGQSSLGGRKSTSTPEFNRTFSALSVILGAKIEDSLKAILPDFRDPETNRYCSSIKRFRNCDISTKKSINDLIANYVFESRELNRDYNSESSLGKWNSGRYKWLNLTNCNSRNGRHRTSSFKTIEFRIFPATTNPENIHLWLLICMGFVWFVENRPNLIREKDVTLQSMMKEVYGKKKIYKFIEERI